MSYIHFEYRQVINRRTQFTETLGWLSLTQLEIRNTHQCIYRICCRVCIKPAAKAAQAKQQTDQFEQSTAKPRTVIVQLTIGATGVPIVAEWGLGTLR